MGFQENLAVMKKAKEAAEQQKKEAAVKAAAEKANAEREAKRGELSADRERVASEFSQAEQNVGEAETALAEATAYAEEMGEDLPPEAKAAFDAINADVTKAKQDFERLKSELERIDAELGGAEGGELADEPAQAEAPAEAVSETVKEEAVEVAPAETAVEEKIEAKEAEIIAENAPEVKTAEMILDDEAGRELTTEEQSKIDDLKSFLEEIKVSEDEKKSFKQIEEIEGELKALLDDKMVIIASKWFYKEGGVMEALKREHPDYYESKLEEMKDDFIDDNNLNPRHDELIGYNLGRAFILGGERGKKVANYERNKPLRIILETYKAHLAKANKELNDEGNDFRSRRMAEVDSLIDKSSKLLGRASQIPERTRLVLGKMRDLNEALGFALGKAKHNLRTQLEGAHMAEFYQGRYRSGVEAEKNISSAKNKYIEELEAMREDLRKMKE